MKKLITFFLAVTFGVLSYAQQQKNPTIMILPGDHWCTSRLYTKQFNNQGKRTIINDYELAFRQDSELSAVVAKVGEMLAANGYQVKDYSRESRAINDRHAENEVTISRSGAEISESPLDILRRTVNYDIEVAVDWDVVADGLTFSIEAFDTYTSKRIATASGVYNAKKDKNSSIETKIENAVKSKVPDYVAQMNSYFENLQKLGREIILTLQVWDSSDVDLESDFDGTELLDHIQDWLDDNTVNGAYNLSNNTESRANFEQVRIPFFNERGRAMDARAFGVALGRYLAAEPFHIESKVMNRGLGEVVIVIGEK